MTKYIVRYTLPYTHRVQVGINAPDRDQAVERAQALFDAGDIWDDTPECPLLFDDFEEDTEAGVPLEFHVDQSIADDQAYPEPDASVRALQSSANARAAARALVHAYQQGEANGGSIEWSDIDTAYELALASRR